MLNLFRILLKNLTILAENFPIMCINRPISNTFRDNCQYSAPMRQSPAGLMPAGDCRRLCVSLRDCPQCCNLLSGSVIVVLGHVGLLRFGCVILLAFGCPGVVLFGRLGLFGGCIGVYFRGCFSSWPGGCFYICLAAQ
jgi:hypothetical protein